LHHDPRIKVASFAKGFKSGDYVLTYRVLRYMIVGV
jgi:hypothetical protein